MKKPELFDIKYKGSIIHQGLTHEECAEVLDELASQYFQGEDIDPSFIELESI